MERMYQANKDRADFYIVYISEAHASDDRFPVPYAKELGIKEHTNFNERCAVADRLVKEKKLTIPILVDNMDDAAAEAYRAWPDRVYLVEPGGQLGVAGDRGPWGFKPGLEAVEKWLEAYEPDEQAASAGVDETDIDDADLDDQALARRMYAAYENRNDRRALKLARRLHERRPDDPDCRYNVACLYARLGEKDRAYEWLERAIDAGFRDGRQMRNDWDFKSLRAEDRFRRLVRRIDRAF